MNTPDWMPELQPYQQTMLDSMRSDLRFFFNTGRRRRPSTLVEFLVFVYNFQNLLEWHYDQTQNQHPITTE